jgi:hypothetical protein
MEKTVRFGCAGSKGIERKLVTGLSPHIELVESSFDSLTADPANRSCRLDRFQQVDLPDLLDPPAAKAASASSASASPRPSSANLNARIDADSDDFAVALDRLYRHLKSRAPERLMQLKTATMSLALRTKASWGRPEHYLLLGYGNDGGA